MSLQYFKKEMLETKLVFGIKVGIIVWAPVMFNATFFLAPSDFRNFLPKHCNTIIKQQLCGKELPPLLSSLQVEVFQEKQGILQQINPCPSNKPKESLYQVF